MFDPDTDIDSDAKVTCWSVNQNMVLLIHINSPSKGRC